MGVCASPAYGAPVAEGRGAGLAQGARGDGESWVSVHDLFEQPGVVGWVEAKHVPIVGAEFVTETGGEVVFVAGQHVDEVDESLVDLCSASGTAVVLPEGGSVVEVVGDDGSVAAGAGARTGLPSRQCRDRRGSFLWFDHGFAEPLGFLQRELERFCDRLERGRVGDEWCDVQETGVD